jgi:hypothetical protein
MSDPFKSSPRPKPVPPTYEPVGKLRSHGQTFDNLHDAVTHFIIHALPPVEVRNKYVIDEIGAIILGYDYWTNMETMFWFGTKEAFAIVQAHPAIDTFEAIGWEQASLHKHRISF